MYNRIVAVSTLVFGLVCLFTILFGAAPHNAAAQQPTPTVTSCTDSPTAQFVRLYSEPGKQGNCIQVAGPMKFNLANVGLSDIRSVVVHPDGERPSEPSPVWVVLLYSGRDQTGWFAEVQHTVLEPSWALGQQSVEVLMVAQQPTPTPSATPFWTACPQNGERPEGVWLSEMRPPPFAGCVVVTTSVPDLAQIRALPTGLGSVCLFPHDGWRVYLFRETSYQGEFWLVQIPDSENCVRNWTWGWEAKSIRVVRLGTAEPRLFLPIVSSLGAPFGPPGPGCVWDEVKRAWDCLIPSEPTRTSTPENILTPPDATATP